MNHTGESIFRRTMKKYPYDWDGIDIIWQFQRVHTHEIGYDAEYGIKHNCPACIADKNKCAY